MINLIMRTSAEWCTQAANVLVVKKYPIGPGWRVLLRGVVRLTGILLPGLSGESEAQKPGTPEFYRLVYFGAC